MTQQAITATIQTSQGDISLRLFHEEAPLTVANFINLAQRGYYQDLNFHRVIDSFMIQGGCPLGTGTGGPGYQFEDECHPDRAHDAPGKLSMANAGPGTNGSQFFITHVPCPHLDGNHTVFGEVLGEQDQTVVNAIQQNDGIFDIMIQGDFAPLLSQYQDRLDDFDSALDEMFPQLVEEEA
ncbi:MAG: peptidylprolyl isomerase [Actinobacteria bacterium]|nr:peptidylprolyl isomerase [Actinomycetota bacterium]